MSHIHEKIDFTTCAYVVYKDKVLLRKHEKYHIWLGPGGHIDLEEDPNQAVVREAKEEVGLDIKLWEGTLRHKEDFGPHQQLIPPVSLNRHRINETHEHIDLVYFARSDTDKVIPENPTDEWRWLKKEELDSLDLLPDIKFFAALALDTLGEK